METGTLGVDSQVWVEANDAGTDFMPGIVTSRDGSYITVHSDRGKETFNVSDPNAKVWRANPRVVDDMTALSFFHVPGILHNLRERSLADEPYTWLGGSVLCSVNPLKPIPDPPGALGTAAAVRSPHPYAMAESAYQQLVFAASRPSSDETVNQSIVVGGESGAGKTEASKMVLRHLAQRSLANSKESAALDDRLIATNPILESMGNAATKRNLSSSRFGVFRRVHWKPTKGKGRDMVICGASVETYLLERSRVTQHGLGERTFHVFYEMVEGSDKAARKALQLDQSFKYLKATADDDVAKGGRRAIMKSMAKVGDLGAQDKANFAELGKALTTVGIKPKGGSGEVSQTDLFGVLAALLHLGNVEFSEKEGAMADEAVVSTAAPLTLAAQLLGLTPEALSKLFIERKVKTRGEEIVAKRDADSAKVALDAVVKAVYVAIFDWLVDRITASLAEEADFATHPHIGVLDIFGFESFRVNSMEQLLINYANEALQSTFNAQIFAAEADLYRKEGLLVASSAPPPDNSAAMALLAGVKGDAKQPGILTIINAETQSPQPADTKLNAAIHRAYTSSQAAKGVFPATHPKDIKHCFTVAHYAGPVKYTTGRFVEKNVDRLPDGVAATMGDSNSPLVSAMFGGGAAKGGKGGAAAASRAMKKATSTVAGRFQLSIEALVSDLAATKAIFIRCIKPNPRMTRGASAAWFSADYVYKQLEALSIPQTAQVLRGGMPTRIPFKDLSDGFGKLLPADAQKVWRVLGGGDQRLFVRAIFTAFAVPPDTYKVGLTRVFFKAGMLDELSAVLEAAAGSKLDQAVADRFRLSILRGRWRTVFAKLAAFSAFNGILNSNRERNSAATILQRLAKRRAREARRRAEEARRLEEERKRKEEEARRLAEEQRRREEEERKKREAAEAARKVAEAERARQLELRAKQLREAEEEKIREQQAEQKRLAAALAKAEKDRVAAEKAEEAEKKKAEAALGGAAALAAQNQKEQTRKVRFAVADNDEEDDDGEDVGPVRAARASSGEAQAIRQKAGKAARKSMAPARGPDGDLSAPVVFSEVKYREVEKRRSLRASMTQFVKKTLTRKGKGAGGLDPRLFTDGDAWETCAVIIHGIRLEYFKKVSEGPGGAPVGETKLGSIELDPELTAMEEVPGATPDEKVLKFTVNRRGKRGKLIIFMLVEDSETMTLRNAYWDAVQRFQDEKKLARKFYRGDLDKFNTDQVREAREWYRQGIISREDFEVLLAEQITTEADKLAAEVGRYGESGVPDFRVECEDCGEPHYILPVEDSKNITYCSECGAPLPSIDPLEEAADALAYRLRKEEDLARKLGQKDRAGFPTAVTTPDGLLVVDPCEVEEVYDPERLERVFRFSFDGKLYRANNAAASRVMDAFSFGGSWSEWKYFRKALADPGSSQRETLPDKLRGQVPAFPEDVAQERDPSRRAQKRVVPIEAFLLELLPASEKMKGFWDLRFVRKMFNLPVSADALARAPVGVLDAEQLAAVILLADELTALQLSGATEIALEMKSLQAVRDSVAATADSGAALSAERLADMSDEEKQQHVQRAADLLEQVDGLLAGTA